MQPAGSGLEFRCATADGKSVQDVLPPTIHPTTRKPYIWRGDWMKLPPLPASILAAWRYELAAAPTARHTPHDDLAPAPETSRLEELVRGRDPDMDYTRWNAVGMALHKATKGAPDGFKIWNDWSKKGKKYPGPDKLQTHWLSFRDDKPNSIGTEYLESHSAATADEFQDLTKMTPKAMIAEAAAQLVQRLIYVESLDQYYDIVDGAMVDSDHALYHRFGATLPPKLRSRVDVPRVLAESRNRQSVNGAAFHPGEDHTYIENGRSYLNQYRHDSIPMIEPTAAEREMIEWLFNRIDEVEFREWLRRFYGHMMQRPGLKIRSAPIFHSAIEGNGKTTMMSKLPRLIAGQQYSQEVTWSEIEDRFSGFLRERWHICMTELKVGSRKEADAVMARIKPWITDDAIIVRAMRQDAINIPNHLIITATSNKSDALLLSPTDRRFGVLELKAPPMTADEIQRVQINFLDGPRGVGVIRHYFQHVPLDGFNPNTPPPRTAAHAAMVEASMPDEQQLVRELIDEQRGAFARDCGEFDDVRRELKDRMGVGINRYRISEALHAAGAMQRHLMPRGKPSRRVWIWRNKARWENASYKDIFEHLDEIG